MRECEMWPKRCVFWWNTNQYRFREEKESERERDATAFATLLTRVCTFYNLIFNNRLISFALIGCSLSCSVQHGFNAMPAMITFCIVIVRLCWCCCRVQNVCVCVFFSLFCGVVDVCSDDACNFITRSAFCRRYHRISIISVALSAYALCTVLQWHHYNGPSLLLFAFNRIFVVNCISFLSLHCPSLPVLVSHRFAIINKLTSMKCFTCRE